MRPSRTVTVSLSPELAKRADRAARAEGRSRSEIFREALRQYLTRQDRWDRIFSYGEEAGRRAGATEETVIEAVKSRRADRGRRGAR